MINLDMFRHFFIINHYFLRFLWIGYNFGLLFILSTFITFSCTTFNSNFFSHQLNFVVSFLFRDKYSINWISPVLFVVITKIFYVMARVYRYCLLTSKQCPCGLVYPEIGLISKVG